MTDLWSKLKRERGAKSVLRKYLEVSTKTLRDLTANAQAEPIATWVALPTLGVLWLAEGLEKPGLVVLINAKALVDDTDANEFLI